MFTQFRVRIGIHGTQIVSEMVVSGTGTFRAQDLSFPRTNSPYGELSFPRLFVPGNEKLSFLGNESSLELSFPGPFVLGNFRSRGTKVPGNFRSLDLSFRGTFVHRTFRSQELLFLRLFYTIWLWTQTAIATVRMCFIVPRPSSVCFPKINWVSLRCVRVVFFCKRRMQSE